MEYGLRPYLKFLSFEIIRCAKFCGQEVLLFLKQKNCYFSCQNIKIISESFNLKQLQLKQNNFFWYSLAVAKESVSHLINNFKKKFENFDIIFISVSLFFRYVYDQHFLKKYFFPFYRIFKNEKKNAALNRHQQHASRTQFIFYDQGS